MKIDTRSIFKSSLAVVLTITLAACGSSSPQGNGTSGKKLQTDSTTNSSPKENDTSSQLQTSSQNSSVSQVGTFETKAPAKDVASSQSALFVAEGDKGVEVIKIGYHDRLDQELITTIRGINATQVSLSEDQNKLYVTNKQGAANVYDISDIHAPRHTRLLAPGTIHKHPVSQNGIYEYLPKQESGMIVYDISNPSHKELVSRFHEVPVYALVLVDQDTKALAASGTMGISLLDLANHEQIQKSASFPIEGKTLGISVNTKSGLLFVANGDKGIKVFNLNIFMDDLR